jgi:hypothetical protein
VAALLTVILEVVFILKRPYITFSAKIKALWERKSVAGRNYYRWLTLPGAAQGAAIKGR